MSLIQHSVLIALLVGHLTSLSLHNINTKAEEEETTTEEVEQLFISDDLEVSPEETLKIYDDNFPSLFGRVTPTRIQETIHELTTLKGADDVGEVSQFSLFHGNDKNTRLDYNKVADSFMRRVQSSYLQNLQTTKSSAVVNEASESGETPVDVVKDDDVFKKIGDNPQITTIRTDIGVSQGEDDQQQYRQINDDSEQFMVEENDDNKELNLNDLDDSQETFNFAKLEDKTSETKTEDKVSYGDNLSFNTGPEDVVYDIIYDYQQPGQDDQYQENIDDDYYENDDGLIMSTLQYHNNHLSNNEEDIDDDYTIEPLEYPEYPEALQNPKNIEDYDDDMTDSVVETEDRPSVVPDQPRHIDADSVYSHSRKSSVFHSDTDDLFKIPVIMDFDAFGSETFSNARLRIPEQFQKLIQQPWMNSYAW